MIHNCMVVLLASLFSRHFFRHVSSFHLVPTSKLSKSMQTLHGKHLHNNMKPITQMMLSSVSSLVARTQVEAPNFSDFEFRQLTLKNGIIVTLVRDGQSEKSSCCLAVAVGAKDDPPEFPGMAHFTEHAVFLGSKKFPQENDYKDYVNKNGGSSNGGTSMESTSYQFTINSQAFGGALDKFSQFFKEPLFAEEALSREVMAIDSEDSKNRILDNRRNLQVLKSLLLSSNSYSKFSTGNVRTLARSNITEYSDDIAALMKAFHSKYYQPQNMAVVLVGPQSLQELEQLAISYFEPIESNNAMSLPTSTESISTSALSQVPQLIPFVKSSSSSSSVVAIKDKTLEDFQVGYPFKKTGIVVKMKPIKESQELSLMFSMPPTRAFYRSDPCHLLTYLLTHRGTNTSLYSILQQRNWAYGVTAGVRTDFEDFSLYQVSVRLSQQGLVHYDSIVTLIYEAVHLIEQTLNHNETYLEKVWQELRTLQDINFKFQDRSSGYDMAQYVVENMIRYPKEHVFSAGYTLDEAYDRPMLREILRRMTPEQSVLQLKSSDYTWLPEDRTDLDPYSEPTLSILKNQQDILSLFPTLANKTASLNTDASSDTVPNRVEAFYGIAYREDPIPAQILSQWSAARQHGVSSEKDGITKALDLPEFNPYISLDLTTTTVGSTLSSLPMYNGRTRSAFPTQIVASPPSPNVSIDNGDASVRASSSLWLSHDQLFGLPKTAVTCFVHTPYCGDGHPANSLLSTLYSRMMSSKYHPASLAGLDYGSGVGKRGFSFTVTGYSPRLPLLMRELCRDWTDDSFWNRIPQSLFDGSKDKLIQSMQSWTTERPDSLADGFLSFILSEYGRLPEDNLKLAREITLPDVIRRAQTIHSHTKFVMYAHGDISKDTAVELYDDLTKNVFHTERQFKPSQLIQDMKEMGRQQGLDDNNDFLTPSYELKARTRILQQPHTRVMLPAQNAADPNSALITYFQVGLRSAKLAAVLLVISRLMSEPIFTTLRTKEQLGYIVSFSLSSYGRYPDIMRGFAVRVLSQRFCPIYMEYKLGDFLSKHFEVFKSLTQADISRMSNTILQSLREPAKSYGDEASNYWDVIFEGKSFDYIDQVMRELEQLQVEDVLSTAEKHLFNASTRTSISMMIFGSEQKESYTRATTTNRISYVDVMKDQPSSSSSDSVFSQFPEEIQTDKNRIVGLTALPNLRKSLPFLEST